MERFSPWFERYSTRLVLAAVAVFSVGAIAVDERETTAPAPEHIEASVESAVSAAVAAAESSVLAAEESPVLLRTSAFDAGEWDLPNLDHERVDYWVARFDTVPAMREKFEGFLERSGKYVPMISAKLAERGMPQDLIFLAMIESGFQPKAYSHASASGLWQFIAATGERYGLAIDRAVDERRDPERATDAALDYLEDLHDRFDSWYLAAAGYNTGENRVGRIMREETGSERAQSEAAAEQQALLAAASVRSSLEAAISAGMTGRARGSLRELMDLESITGARVYATDGRILVSADRSEEGTRPSGMWVPSARDLPQRGVARPTPEGDAVQAFLPIRAGGASILEVDFSLHELEEAMDRAARLGLLLLIGSVAAVILIVATMLEREVMTPIERVVGILGPKGSGDGSHTVELARIEESVADLLRKEEAAKARVAEQEERLAKQAGFAQVGEMAAEMAHEFKRPLASIRSAVSLLEQEYELNDQAQTLLSAVDGQLGRLTETMQDLFALAKPVEMRTEQVDLRDTVDGALANLGSLTDTKGRRVERDYDPDLPTIAGDSHRLEQAVLNLMLNAMEAMEEGGVLRVSLKALDGHVLARFDDTGPGIPAEEVEKVVLPFYSTKPSGTGLGLPLVARVVAAHGGVLDIRSEAGEGTTVEISLPVGVIPAPNRPEGEWQANES